MPEASSGEPSSATTHGPPPLARHRWRSAAQVTGLRRAAVVTVAPRFLGPLERLTPRTLAVANIVQARAGRSARAHRRHAVHSHHSPGRCPWWRRETLL